MPNVVHDRRIEGIQIVPGDAVERLHAELEAAAREVAEQEHHGVADERQAPDQHQHRALVQAGVLRSHVVPLSFSWKRGFPIWPILSSLLCSSASRTRSTLLFRRCEIDERRRSRDSCPACSRRATVDYPLQRYPGVRTRSSSHPLRVPLYTQSNELVAIFTPCLISAAPSSATSG